MKKKLRYLLLLPLLFLLVACGGQDTDSLGMTGNTFTVDNKRTDKDYSTVTITEPEGNSEITYAVGLLENGRGEEKEVITIPEEPEENGYYLVTWGRYDYLAERIDNEIYFWFTHNPDEIGSTEENHYVLKLTEE